MSLAVYCSILNLDLLLVNLVPTMVLKYIVGIDRLNSLRSKIDSCERALAEKTAK